MKLYQSSVQQGFTLIEILVAILVLSFGLIGLASLIALGMKSNQTAYYRTIATQQANDMADRIRSNLVGAQAGNYNAITAVVGASTNCITSSCTPAQMAAYDAARWNTLNGILLPNGSGTVAGTATTGYTITLSWAERSESGSAMQNFSTRIMP